MYVVMRMKDPAWMRGEDDVPVGAFHDLGTLYSAVRAELVRVIGYAESKQQTDTSPEVADAVRRRLWKHLVSCHRVFEIPDTGVTPSGQETPPVSSGDGWLAFNPVDFG